MVRGDGGEGRQRKYRSRKRGSRVWVHTSVGVIIVVDEFFVVDEILVRDFLETDHVYDLVVHYFDRVTSRRMWSNGRIDAR